MWLDPSNTAEKAALLSMWIRSTLMTILRISFGKFTNKKVLKQIWLSVLMVLFQFVWVLHNVS